jgi:hypothetical protein
MECNSLGECARYPTSSVGFLIPDAAAKSKKIQGGLEISVKEVRQE